LELEDYTLSIRLDNKEEIHMEFFHKNGGKSYELIIDQKFFNEKNLQMIFESPKYLF